MLSGNGVVGHMFGIFYYKITDIIFIKNSEIYKMFRVNFNNKRLSLYMFLSFLFFFGCGIKYTPLGESKVISENTRVISYSVKKISEPSINEPTLILNCKAKGEFVTIVKEQYKIKKHIALFIPILTSVVGITTGVVYNSKGYAVLGRDITLAAIGSSISMFIYNLRHKAEEKIWKEKMIQSTKEFIPTQPFIIKIKGTNYPNIVFPDKNGMLKINVFEYKQYYQERRPFSVFLYSPDNKIVGEFVINTGLIASIFATNAEIQKLPPEKKVEKQPENQPSHFPPDLSISQIIFAESSGNKALDAYENGEISFVIENKGKGDAQGVNIRIVQLAGEGEIDYSKELEIGTIPANSQKSVKIPINAAGETRDEIIKLRIETYEQFGFDADPFTVSFETKKFNPPNLVVASVGVDDDKEGDSYGDNDGIVELGEQIEVKLALQNTGIGDANNTTVELIIPDEGKNLYFNSTSHQFDLGNIISGGYKQVDFILALAKRYNKENILIKTKINESTGKASKIDSIFLPVGKPSGYGKEITIVAQPEQLKAPQTIPSVIDVEQPIEKYGQIKENGLCVIVGIEEYKKAPASLFSNRDGITFYEYAKGVLGIKEKNIYIVTNEDASKGEFDKIFSEDGWLARRVNAQSEIFFYFSGHGSADMKTQKQYLVPYDIDPNYPQTAYSLDEIYERLSALKVKSAIVLLDACFSGQSREGTLLLAGARPLVVSKISEPLGNITVMSATGGSEIASAYPEMKHGLFTYYLLKGLRCDADLNNDKIITTTELSNYLSNNVSNIAQNMGREQHPQLLGKSDYSIVEYK